jgi:hypothetical protein
VPPHTNLPAAHVADAVRSWYSRIDDESTDGAAVERIEFKQGCSQAFHVLLI